MLADAGFDIAHLFDTALIADDPALSIIAGAGGRGALLVGNTRALWPAFCAARAADVGLAADLDPLERYIEQTITRAFPAAPTWFAHRRYNYAFLPFQRLAVRVGFGALAPTQLVIHPAYGPWFALRAVIVIGDDPPRPPPLRPPYQCTGACDKAFRSACNGRDWRAWLAVRDACTVGREFRYSDDQIAYHYTKAFTE